MPIKPKSPLSVFPHFAWLVQKLRLSDRSLPRVCLMMVAVGLGIPLSNVLFPKLVIGAALREPPSPVLLAGVILAFFIITTLCNGLHNYYQRRNGVYLMNFGYKLQESLQEIAMTMPFPMTEDSRVLGELRLAKEFIPKVQPFIETACRCLSAALLLAGYALLTARLSPLLLPAFAGCTVLDALAMRRLRQEQAEARGALADADRKKDYLFQTLFDYRFGKEVRLFHLAGLFAEKFSRQRDEKQAHTRALEKKRVRAQALELLLGLACEAAVYLMLLKAYLSRGLAAEDFVLYTGLAASFSIVSRGFIADLHQLSLLNVSAADCRGFIERYRPCDAAQAEGAHAPEKEGGPALSFERVSFRYPGMERDILQDISFSVAPGAHVSIVGENGAGKSTIARLICRLYRPDSGRILLNGRDIWDYDPQEYGRKLAAVFQESRLFACSLQENICSGEAPDPTRMWEALRAVGMEEKIRALPQKENSNVLKQLYEDGVEFSGGEAQRLCIARAVYRGGSLLLLDEPTAALDALAEKRIYESFSEISRGKTVFFISHRLNSNRFCDQVLYLEKGKIAAQGSHEQLLQACPSYRALYELQARHYQQEGAAG